MSVIVRMEMPKNCAMCRCHVDGWCYLLSAFEIQSSKCTYDSRPSWCPIIGVLPEQHGRLIDASTVLFAADDSKGEVPPMPVTVDDYLESFDLPTIVPATERSET